MKTNRIHITPVRSLQRLPLLSSRSQGNDQGLTLVECIMAIVVIGITGAAIAPMMLVSVATRVQSQKAEQALAIAQGEVDRVRVQFEQGRVPSDDSADAGFVPRLTGVTDDRAPNVAGPASTTDATVIGVDIDRDGTDDFVLQRYLVEKAGAASTYDMGVRVYDFDTVDNATGTLPTDEARLGMTGSQGERANKPLAVLYTTVSLTETTDSLCNLIDYTDDGTAQRPPSCTTAPTTPTTP